jgi:hypothetical protein
MLLFGSLSPTTQRTFVGVGVPLPFSSHARKPASKEASQQGCTLTSMQQVAESRVHLLAGSAVFAFVACCCVAA